MRYIANINTSLCKKFFKFVFIEVAIDDTVVFDTVAFKVDAIDKVFVVFIVMIVDVVVVVSILNKIGSIVGNQL